MKYYIKIPRLGNDVAAKLEFVNTAIAEFCLRCDHVTCKSSIVGQVLDGTYDVGIIDSFDFISCIDNKVSLMYARASDAPPMFYHTNTDGEEIFV